MASFMRKMAQVPHNLPHGTAPRGFMKGFVVDKAERYGAAFLYGAAKGYYGERFLWRGHGLDAWTGAGALLASSVLTVFSGGRSKLAPHLERIGDAGVMSALGSVGAAWGLSKAGRSVAVLSPGKNAGAGAGLPGKRAVVGAIPPAARGPYLSREDMLNFSRR